MSADLERIAILTGGEGREREGSLASARDVAALMARQGRSHEIVDIRDLKSFHPERFQAAFLTTHGEGGEDGILQGYLTKLCLPYTGSGVAASAVCMDKCLSSWVAQALGCTLPEFMTVRPGTPSQPIEEFLLKHKKCIVKPARGGGSLGVEELEDLPGFEAYVAGRDGDDREALLLCQRVYGHEISCAVIRAGSVLSALPLLETEFDNVIYTYAIKHTPTARQHHCPARIPDHLAESVVTASKRVYDALEMAGYARFDFIVDVSEDTAWFLECNTIPGFSRQSNLAQMAAGIGMSYEDLVKSELASCLAGT